jgi:hypothetical protein
MDGEHLRLSITQLRPSGILPITFNLLYVHIIDLSHVIIGTADRLEQFVKLGVDRLGVAMLGSLDQEGHGPRRQSSKGMPLESVTDDQPEGGVDQKDPERSGVRR